MSRTKAIRLDIESVRADAAWRLMTFEEFEERFVTEMVDMSEARLGKIIQRLSPQSFNQFRKKLWDEQAIEPNPDDTYESFDKSMPFMVLLKRSMLLRLVVLEDDRDRRALNQQLGMLSLMMQPHVVAALTGMPLDEDDIDEEEEEEEEEMDLDE